MEYVAPKTCSTSNFKSVPDNITLDTNFLESYFGCPISTRTVTRMSPGSFERSCKAHQKKLEENKRTDGRFILSKHSQICSTCSVGKRVIKDETITELPKSFMIEIYDFNLPVSSVISKIEIVKKTDPNWRNKPRKLNWEIVRSIREDRKNKMKFKDIAEKYKLSMSRVKDIVYDRIWVEE